MSQLAHSATQKINKIGGDSGLINNPFLKKDGFGQKNKGPAGGREGANNYFDEEDEMLMIGDGYFNEEDLRITKIDKLKND